MNVNLNDFVRARLNADGLRTLHADPSNVTVIKYSLNGNVLEVPLWEYMRIFGPSTYVGMWVPTEQNEIEILPNENRNLELPVAPRAALHRPTHGGRP